MKNKLVLFISLLVFALPVFALESDEITKEEVNGFAFEFKEDNINLDKKYNSSVLSIGNSITNSSVINGIDILVGNYIEDKSNRDYSALFGQSVVLENIINNDLFVIGSYVLQKENQEKLFLNAGRVRRLIVDRMNELFTKYDGLIMPTSGDIAPLFDKASDKLSDEYLILGNHLEIGNFGGFPSISIPSGFVNDMPVSVNITGRAKEDYLVLNIANKMEEVLGYKGQVSNNE